MIYYYKSWIYYINFKSFIKLLLVLALLKDRILLLLLFFEENLRRENEMEEKKYSYKLEVCETRISSFSLIKASSRAF